MSYQTQKKHMATLSNLLGSDLSYIFGERESGLNGAKKEFLTKSAAFMRALGKDLGFSEMEVRVNKSGIACSGSVSLYGMWGEGNGLCFVLEQPSAPFDALLYRSISHIRDFTGGTNQWLPCSVLQSRDYYKLLSILLALKKRSEVRNDRAA